MDLVYDYVCRNVLTLHTKKVHMQNHGMNAPANYALTAVHTLVNKNHSNWQARVCNLQLALPRLFFSI